MNLAKEKGSSSWLTALPLTEYGFTLHKGAFHDALALRYGWTPDRLPSKCACGASFSVEHTLSCAKGGFPLIRHNEIRDLTATLLTEVCNDVCTEPELQPVTDEELIGATANSQAGAQLDIAANGVWGVREANIFYKRLASMLASMWDHSYSSTLCWLRCRLSFSLLRSSIQAIRGARSSCGRAIRMPTVVDLVNSESHLSSA